MSEKSAEPQVTVHLIIRPDADLLGVGSRTGGAARRSSGFHCCCGQGKGTSVSWKPQQQLPRESASFNPGPNEKVLMG